MQLGRYQVLSQLATGSVADVLLARASGLEGFARHVVIKRIHLDLTNEERFVSAFLEEARISASLHHQNIVQVHDIGDEGGAVYFAMEYVHGEDVRKLINRVRERNEVVPLQHVMSIIMATASGLHYAHEQLTPTGQPKGIVHRDVSPANILIGYDGSVKLVDFGLAKAAQRSTNATSSGTLKGKSSYMSPEQCTGKPLDRRTDTFGLGIVLFELLTAQRLFKGATEFMTMAAIVDGEIPRPSSLRPDVPPALDDIIVRALSRAPESRFQTAEAMRESLEAFSVASELRTSSKSLADYMIKLFGEKPEPWLATVEQKQHAEQNWTDLEMTHAGVVALPRNQQDMIARFAPRAESPMALAQSDVAQQFSEDAEHEATAGQLPSLREMRRQNALPTEPTATLREPSSTAPTQPVRTVTPAVGVNVIVRPTTGDPTPTPRAVIESTTPRRGDASSPRVAVESTTRPKGDPTPLPRPVIATTRPKGDPTPLPRASPLKLDERGALVADTHDKRDDITGVQSPSVTNLDVTEILAPAAAVDRSEMRTQSARPLRKNAETDSSTLVAPPIFAGRADDDDGLDDDEPATEIALTTPEHMPSPPPVEKVPLALRKPPRVALPDGGELQRMTNAPPAPLRAAPKAPFGGTGALAAQPGPREVTPSSSPPSPVAPYGPPPGVDPLNVAAPPRPSSAPIYGTPPMVAMQPDASEKISGFGAGSRRIAVIIGVGVTIVVAGMLAMRSCESDTRTAPSAAPPDAEPAPSADAGTAAAPPPVDAGVRDAGARDAGTRDAGTRDAGTATKRTPPRRPPPRRPKGK